METKALKKQMGAAIAMVLVAAIALGAATFAWFVNNTKVTADSATVTAKSANTLLISHGDSGNWGTTAEFSPVSLNTLVPVSTVNGADFFKDSKWSTETGETQKGQYNASGFTAAESGKDFYVDTFKVKASQACGLYLDNETKFTVNDQTESDALKSMRLALKVDNNVFFYQVDATNISGSGNSYNTTLVSMDADGVKQAISGANTAAKINGKNVDSNAGVISLEKGEVTAPSDSTTLVAKDDSKKLCDLAANESKDVQVYIWMEGCDYDCNSVVVKQITEQAVKCVLGFCAGNNEAA